MWRELSLRERYGRGALHVACAFESSAIRLPGIELTETRELTARLNMMLILVALATPLTRIEMRCYPDLQIVVTEGEDHDTRRCVVWSAGTREPGRIC